MLAWLQAGCGRCRSFYFTRIHQITDSVHANSDGWAADGCTRAATAATTTTSDEALVAMGQNATTGCVLLL